jgi:hypothetical protein
VAANGAAGAARAGVRRAEYEQFYASVVGKSPSGRVLGAFEASLPTGQPRGGASGPLLPPPPAEPDEVSRRCPQLGQPTVKTVRGWRTSVARQSAEWLGQFAEWGSAF